MWREWIVKDLSNKKNASADSSAVDSPGQDGANSQDRSGSQDATSTQAAPGDAKRGRGFSARGGHESSSRGIGGGDAARVWRRSGAGDRAGEIGFA